MKRRKQDMAGSSKNFHVAAFAMKKMAAVQSVVFEKSNSE